MDLDVRIDSTATISSTAVHDRRYETMCFKRASLARLCDYVDKRGLAPLNHFERAPDGRAKVIGIGYWPFAMHAHTLCQLCKVDVRFTYCRSNTGAGNATIVP